MVSLCSVKELQHGVVLSKVLVMAITAMRSEVKMNGASISMAQHTLI